MDEATNEQREQYEAEEERTARLADSYGFDSDPFRSYLVETPDSNPLGRQAIALLESRIKITSRILAELEAMEEAQNQEAALTRSPPKLELDADRLQATLDGERYGLTDEQLRILRLLLVKPGAWVMGRALRNGADQRVDKIINRLPPQIRSLIDSHKRHGYRLNVNYR